MRSRPASARSVVVRVEAEATPDVVAVERPSVVVVATGGRIVWPELPGARLPAVSRGLDPERIPAGRRVVVVGGRLAVVEYVEMLAGEGRLVSLLATGPEIGAEVGLKRRTEHFGRVDRLGITVHAGCAVVEITESSVRFVPIHGTSRGLPADAVVLAGTVEPDPALGEAVAARLPGVPVHVIGDAAVGLGLIRGATADAARVVREIGL